MAASSTDGVSLRNYPPALWLDVSIFSALVCERRLDETFLVIPSKREIRNGNGFVEFDEQRSCNASRERLVFVRERDSKENNAVKLLFCFGIYPLYEKIIYKRGRAWNTTGMERVLSLQDSELSACRGSSFLDFLCVPTAEPALRTGVQLFAGNYIKDKTADATLREAFLTLRDRSLSETWNFSFLTTCEGCRLKKITRGNEESLYSSIVARPTLYYAWKFSNYEQENLSSNSMFRN